MDIRVHIEDVVLGAEELHYAAHAVGKISGPVDIEDVLDVIFSQFYREVPKLSLDCHCPNGHTIFLNSIIGMSAENESSHIKPFLQDTTTNSRTIIRGNCQE